MSIAHILAWATLGTTLGAALLAALRKPKAFLSRAALAAVPAGVATSAWLARASAAGHLPLFGTYESALSLATFVLVTSFLWESRGRFRVGTTAASSLLAAVVLGHGLLFFGPVSDLTISERSWVVDLHALVAWAAFAILTTSAALALRDLRSQRPPSDPAWGQLPRGLQLGFALHTAMIATGSLYKFLLFGKTWSFDPIESFALITWLAYGALLHMHLLGRWRRERLARWSLGVFFLLLASYRLITYFPPWSTYHIFDVQRRIHVM